MCVGKGKRKVSAALMRHHMSSKAQRRENIDNGMVMSPEAAVSLITTLLRHQ